jgi:hypothetical protein
VETIEYTHGAGFVKSQLRLFTDYPILPRLCVPQLAAVLAAAQHTAVTAALSVGVAFGLSAPDAAVADLFLPAQGGMHSQAPWYRGLNRNEYLYRCGGNQTAEETWVVTGSRDEDAWSRCEGRVWIDLDSARARTDATDRLSAVGGVFFDLSLRQCGEEFARIQIHSANTESVPDGADRSEQDRSLGLMAFPPGVPSAHVACSLVWRLGPLSTIQGDGRSTTVLLPAGTIQLLGNIVVRAGESLKMQGDGALQASLALGRWQLVVEAGGRLELLGLAVVDAVGSSAMVVFGEVMATNCTFSRCVSGPNLLLRFAEDVSLEGSDEHPPVQGAYVSSVGAVAFVVLSPAKFTAHGCTFSENRASGARLVNAGAAIGTLGGSLVLCSGTIMRDNVAEGGAMFSRGGAIYSTYSQIDISDVMFVGNEANGGSDGTDAVNVRRDTNWLTQMARGGAADLNNCRVTISSTTFKQNRAQDASVRAAGGALAVGEGSVVAATRCWFDRNEALRGGQITNGGALRIDSGGSFRAVDTNFDGNAVDAPAEGFGGAIVTEGSLVLGGGVVFRANVVYGDVRAAGGAIAVLSTTASFNASEIPGPVFVGNAVRLAPRTASQLQAKANAAFGIRYCRFSARMWKESLLQVKGTKPHGGALYFEAAGTALLVSALFESNSVLVRPVRSRRSCDRHRFASCSCRLSALKGMAVLCT